MSSSQAQPGGSRGARTHFPTATLGTVTSLNIASLFPDEDYRFHMRFDRRDIAAFFRPTANYSTVVAQRQHWLKSAPTTYCVLEPEGIPLLAETIAMAHRLGTLPARFTIEADVNETPRDQCLSLGTVWEPDFLLLKPDTNGKLRLTGGCVCFPSSWSLTERVGNTVAFIHEVVPGLNPSLNSRIDQFLKNLKPGKSWERYNWGISRSPQLNQHPDQKLPCLDASVELDEVWLRIEHQSFVALPESQGVLFAIRIVVRTLLEIKSEPEIVVPLTRALRTMPEEMARYKNIHVARGRILQLLFSPPKCESD